MHSEYEAFITAQSRKNHPAPATMLSAIKSLLIDSSTPPSAAAREAVSCFVTESSPDPDYTSLWPLLFETIGKFTEQNDRLVDFVVELQGLPDCNGAFRRLDGLSEYMTEFVFDYVDRPFYDPQRDEKRQAWVNVNAFAAKLYARGIRANHVGHLRHGGWVLRKTLEKAPWEKFHHEDIEQELEDLDSDEDDEYCEVRDRLLEEIDIRTLNGIYGKGVSNEVDGIRRLVKGTVGVLERKIRLDQPGHGLGSKDTPDSQGDGPRNGKHRTGWK
ncbi:hypothetical protein ATEIFO6365_0004071100 [Aspergillus terreus]|uniref:Uncharacterized protein n=1 Tax=Aspergillus terreus TaxID=33178 RepID=A0A5M3YPY8_ASPTE|nr:hypothetical protein ATETN484_0002073600 [Aspergillus terreus]GFF15592.1 hypothetical protein ATEIFO6365_0004071100 [Aspergillus terreus]